MNFKTMAYFIITLGIAVMLFGGAQFIANLPKKFDRSQSEMTIFGRNDLGNYFNTQAENYTREEKRKTATVIMIAGGVLSFLGIGVYMAAKKKD